MRLARLAEKLDGLLIEGLTVGFFGRRKEDVVPLPVVVTPKAVFELNQLAERGVVALVAIFFGTMWFGVNDARIKLATIESEIKTLPVLKQDIKDLEGRVRALEIRK